MYVYLQLSPGIDVEKTPLLNSTGFSASTGIRFFQGLVQKAGGWQHINDETFVGTATGLHAWADLYSTPYIAIGTDQRLQIFGNGVLYDVTPIRKTDNVTPKFSTHVGQTDVSVNDPVNLSMVGDWINIIVPVSVGGNVLYGFYQITVENSANVYIVHSANPATITVSSGGDVPAFTATSGSATILVVFANHGLSTGDAFNVDVSTTVGGIALVGQYIVTVIDANQFTITAGVLASSTQTVSENNGKVRIEYLVYSGLDSAGEVFATGYGMGPYGLGPYGISNGAAYPVPLRQWFLDNFGQYLIGNYTGSPLYLWKPPATTGNVALPIDAINFPGATSPPTEVNISFVTPQEIVVAFGCDDRISGIFDPNLVRWSTVGDFTQWVPTSANQAGSQRLSTGSRIVSAISAPNFIVIWTDVDMYLMNYLGGTALSQLVWSFNKIEDAVPALSARSCAVYRNLVLWASSNGFFAFDGNSIRSIPCPVWDIFWFNLNRDQIDKVNCQVNSWFSEVSWAFPSATGSGDVDSRITLNVEEGSWTYDIPISSPTSHSRWARTAWIDDNVYGAPIGAQRTGYLQQHEIGYNADGIALPASITTGWFAISEGSVFTSVREISEDAIITGGTQTIQITLDFQDYPQGPVRTYGPYSWTAGSAGPPYSIVRGRGRFARITYASSDLDVFWRVGRPRYDGSVTGRR